MRGNIRRGVLKYGIATAVGALMTWAVIAGQGYAQATDAAERYRILADAFTVPGTVLMLCAALVWIANQEMFLGLSYVGGRAIRALIPFARRSETPKTYYDYVTRKRERGKVRGYGFLFVTGAVFFGIALVFTYLFYFG